MALPSTVKRILAATPFVLVAAWILSPTTLTTDLDEELAQRGVTVTAAPKVLGTTVEGVAVRLNSDSAPTASIEIVSADGTSTGLVDLPYVTYLDGDATSFTITASVAMKASIGCTIEQNTTVLAANTKAGTVVCTFDSDDASTTDEG